MEPFLAILHKYRPSHFANGVTGWDGCRCGCHGPRPVVMHFRACCQPSYEDFEAILDLYHEKSEASVEMDAILHEIINHALSTPFGFFFLPFGSRKRPTIEPRRMRKRPHVFSELSSAEYERLTV